MELLTIFQVAIAIALMASILMQNRGSSTSGLFGGGGGNVYMTRRGLEKKLFYSTIVLSVLFFVVSFLNVLI